MPQHSTWDDDDTDTEINGDHDDITGDDSGDDSTDWEEFDASIRSDADTWCERVGARRD